MRAQLSRFLLAGVLALGLALLPASVPASSFVSTAPAGSSLLGAGGGLTVPADTTEDTLATVSIPALSASGCIRVNTFWSATGAGGVKTPRTKLAAQDILSTSLAVGADQIQATTIFCNRGTTSTNTRSTYVIDFSAGTVGAAGSAALALNTGVATSLVITGQKAASGDTLILQSYTVEKVAP